MAHAHASVGYTLIDLGKPAEAMDATREALSIRAKIAAANPAMVDFQKAVAESYCDLAYLYRDTGKLDEAVKSLEAALAIQQKAEKLDPNSAFLQESLAASHQMIGSLLADLGKPAEAMKALEAALAIRRRVTRERPEIPGFAGNLGETLDEMARIDLGAKRFRQARARLREAVEWQRKALAASPVNPFYRRSLIIHLNNLIRAARGLDDAEGVAEAERELARLGDADPALAALDARLFAIIKGEQRPEDEADRLRLARRAYDKALHATAARLWGEAFAANPKLGDDRRSQYRYSAARAAVLACSDQGKDIPRPDAAAKAKLRAQALGWLKAEVLAWKRVAMTADFGNAGFAAQALDYLRKDAILASVHDPVALDALPEAERTAWRAFWAEVDELAAKFGKP